MTLMSDSLLRALGWALAHSLWQGALVALMLLVLLPRLRMARQRYWAAYGALTTLTTLVFVTFAWHYEPRDQPFRDTHETMESASQIGVHFVENQTLVATFREAVIQWLDANHALIVNCWLVGFVFFMFRLGGGLWQLHRLRTRGLITLDAVWQEKLRAWSHRIGVAQPVTLLESALVRSPLTIGWLKPAILLPIGFVNHLSVAEVEAVLAHELAHIARRDWLFNLLQALVESVFYYHPAVWWISGVVRRERENACDDTALIATGNPIAFARALVQVQEMATPLPSLALAMTGKRARPLLERVRRILNQPQQQQRHQAMEKITATLILVALLALVGLRANSVPSIGAAFAQIAELPTTFFSEQNSPAPDSLPKPKSNRKIIHEDETGRVEAEYKDGKISRLNIDGKEIPATEFEYHQAIIEELSENISIPRPPRPNAPEHEEHGFDGQRPPAPPSAPRMFWFRTPETPGPPNAPNAPRPPMGGISIVTDEDGEGNTIIRLEGNGGYSEVIVRDGEVWLNGTKMELGQPFDMPGLRLFSDGEFMSGFRFGDADFNWNFSESFPEINHEQIRREMELARKELERGNKVMEKEHQSLRAEQRAMEAQYKSVQEKLKSELLSDGLISNPNSFSLSLDSKTLKVNKKKQSEAMRRKYEELLRGMSQIKGEGDNWNFNFHFSDRE